MTMMIDDDDDDDTRLSWRLINLFGPAIWRVNINFLQVDHNVHRTLTKAARQLQ